MSPPEENWIQLKQHTKHPLEEVYKNSKFKCKCCRLKGKGIRYRCNECNLDIHTTCGTCPPSLDSFKHPKHTVQLMKRPHLPNHKCHLCQKRVKGMVYRCKECNFFMHPVCSDLRELLSNHAIHPPHTLKLQLMENNKCDVCDKTCNQWRYYCGICDVHIHVGCLDGKNDESNKSKIMGEIASTVAQGIISAGLILL